MLARYGRKGDATSSHPVPPPYVEINNVIIERATSRLVFSPLFTNSSNYQHISQKDNDIEEGAELLDHKLPTSQIIQSQGRQPVIMESGVITSRLSLDQTHPALSHRFKSTALTSARESRSC